MPLETVFVKEEPCVKVESEEEMTQGQDYEGLCGVSTAATEAGLYTGHMVKDELVLGPEVWHRPEPVQTQVLKNMQLETVFIKEEPCVKMEPEEKMTQGQDYEVLCGVSAAAAEPGLYTEHVVKDELVLGPEVWHRPGPMPRKTGQNRKRRQQLNPRMPVTTAYNHAMTDQPDEPMDPTDLPLPLTIIVLAEAQHASGSTSATPLAEAPTITAPKSQAQIQREYRQRIAASRTAAQAIAARKWDTERKRNYRLRKAANSALVSASLESTTASSSRSGARLNDVQTGTQRQLTHQQRETSAAEPAQITVYEPMDLMDLPLLSRSNLLAEAQDAAASTSPTPFAEPLIMTAPKSQAQIQREYRQRKAASRTAAQAIAARKSNTERMRNYRLRKAANSALVSASLESTTASSSRSGTRSNDVQTGTQRQLTHQQRQTPAAEPAQITPDQPMIMDLPLPSRSNVITKAQDAAASTSATPFAEPLIMTAPKSKAQKQRRYRQRIAASRTPAQAIAARKSEAERRRNYRLRKAANSALVSASLESTTASSSRSLTRSNDVQTGTQRPLTQSKAQKQRGYRQRIAESRTSEQAIAARKSDAERQRNYRLRKAASRKPTRTYFTVVEQRPT